jgi:N-methylhydantoinase B/oxoprolinase/acetone carboxylase alpha subunit
LLFVRNHRSGRVPEGEEAVERQVWPEAQDRDVLAGSGAAGRETVGNGFRWSLLFLQRAEAAVLM